jgi:hypothetical protein
MFIWEIVIVWWISQNDHFIKFLEKKFQGKYTISRPLLDYRFDNASMLWVLAYNIKKHNTQFPFSQIIT